MRPPSRQAGWRQPRGPPIPPTCARPSRGWPRSSDATALPAARGEPPPAAPGGRPVLRAVAALREELGHGQQPQPPAARLTKNARERFDDLTGVRTIVETPAIVQQDDGAVLQPFGDPAPDDRPARAIGVVHAERPRDRLAPFPPRHAVDPRVAPSKW